MTAAVGVETRRRLLDRLADARAETDRLFWFVKPDALYDRPIAERHRIIFYLGHLEAFDWNLLRPRLPGLKTFDESLDKLFAFGIDPIGGGLPTDVPADWPARSQVEEYNLRVRSVLDDALDRLDFADWEGSEPPDLLMNVVIEHRLMHAETLSYMLHQLPYTNKLSIAQPPVPESRSMEPGPIHISAGDATLGLSRNEPVFGWDNEFERHAVSVPAFSIDRYKVTNGDFLDFVHAGGYRERRFWPEADWQWKERCGIEHPLFWRCESNGYRYRGMFEEIPLPLDWPVYVSHAEAAAYAALKGRRLPTEAEWHRAAYGGQAASERSYPWGEELPDLQHGYFDMRRWDPSPVNAFPAGRSASGVEGTLGNGWEWTSSLFTPFADFRPFSFYPGYSADFFDGRHYVLKGGSPRTESCMLRSTFRNWFQAHYPYVYAGFRCASDEC